MGNILNSSEIVELGIQIEKNGFDFYTGVALKSKNQNTKERFLYLADQEKQHILVFQEILNKADKYQPVESYDGENMAYLNAVAGEHVFTQKGKGGEMAQSVETDKEAVDLAINFEKDSIIFFLVIKKVVPVQQHNIIDALIRQEQGHLVSLVELKQTL